MSVGSAKYIEVFADVGCPFTHVGLLRFVESREERARQDVRLRVRSWPLEIVNGEPMSGSFIAEEVAEICEQVSGYFDGFDGTAFPSSSLGAMALASVAGSVDVAVGESVSLELRDLLFEHNTDVSDPEVLEAVAKRWSVPFDTADSELHRQIVLEEHREGVARGVTGSPHFFTSSGDFFCPALAVGRDESGHLRVTTDPGGFGRFLEACFA